MKQKKKDSKLDYTTIALASMTINAWKDYEKYANELAKKLKERGYNEENDYDDAESFVSDVIIGNELDNPLEFEKEAQKKLKKK